MQFGTPMPWNGTKTYTPAEIDAIFAEQNRQADEDAAEAEAADAYLAELEVTQQAIEYDRMTTPPDDLDGVDWDDLEVIDIEQIGA